MKTAQYHQLQSDKTESAHLAELYRQSRDIAPDVAYPAELTYVSQAVHDVADVTDLFESGPARELFLRAISVTLLT